MERQEGKPKSIISKAHLAYGLIVAYDMLTIALSYFLALWLRFDGHISRIPSDYFNAYKDFIPWYLVICLGLYTYIKLYNSIWRFASVIEVERITLATVSTGVLHAALITILYRRMPISYYIIGMTLQFLFGIGIRFSYRLLLLIRKRRGNDGNGYKKVMVIGAGDAGREVIREIIRAPKLREEVVCLIDDDEEKIGKEIEGVPIVGNRNDILKTVEAMGVEKIYIALPSAGKRVIRDIVNICKESDCEVMNLPGVYQIANGNIKISDMKKVDIEDLLGRDVIKTDMGRVFDMIHGKVVLITGGGGSIGSEIAMQVATHSPKQLIIFDVYENNAYDIQNKIKREVPDCNLEVLIGSVRDSRRVNDIFKKYRPNLVYHAAAHKHVPLMEVSPCEAIKNNVIGTYKVAYAAMMYGAQRFVLISTDKAVNPTNIMGASKRLCELVIQGFDKMIKNGREAEIPPLYIHEENPRAMYDMKDGDGFFIPGRDGKKYANARTEYVAVRFGNVLGSNGSVIPLFREQIRRGGPVTVTHPDIIRYFMTIPEAASLVLSAGTYANGGEIFILDMGEPVKIDDLARNLIKLSGLEPDKDIKIEYTGLRSGEKLYEEKLMAEEGLIKTPNDLIHIGKPVEFNEDKLFEALSMIMLVAYENSEAVKLLMEMMVKTYNPSEKLSMEQKAEYDKEIARILRKYGR